MYIRYFVSLLDQYLIFEHETSCFPKMCIVMCAIYFKIVKKKSPKFDKNGVYMYDFYIALTWQTVLSCLQEFHQNFPPSMVNFPSVLKKYAFLYFKCSDFLVKFPRNDPKLPIFPRPCSLLV